MCKDDFEKYYLDISGRIKSIGKTKAELHMSVSDLKEEDSIEVLFPGCM